MRAWIFASAAAVATLTPLGERSARAATWTGTWSVSPQSSSTTFTKQTLRQIVHTSISGTSARIQLSNAFGAQPVTIADVHVAQRDSGSSIVAGTDAVVTFGGQSSTTIAVGAVAVSDAIAFTVPPLSDVAVSFYLPDATGAATSHQLGNQTSYVASGDVSGNPTLSNPQTNGSYYFLVNLDVENPHATGAVVALGASITDGYASTSDANERWPNDLAGRLADAGMTVGVLNQGISGNALLTDGAGPSALHRFAPDVLAQPGVRWVIVSDDPINDLGSGNPPTSAQLIAGLQQLIASAHASGLKYLCSTLTPFQGASYWTQAGETGREAVNAFLRSASSGCDGIVDQDTATHDPSAPTQYLPAYDSGDHLHPNDLGYQAIAKAVDLALLEVAASPDAGGTDAASSADATSETSDAGKSDTGTSDTGPTDAGETEDGPTVTETDGGPPTGAAPETGDAPPNGGSANGCSTSFREPGEPERTGTLGIALTIVAFARRRARRRHPCG